MIPQIMQRIAELEAIVKQQENEMTSLNLNLQELRQQLQVERSPQAKKVGPGTPVSDRY